MWSRTVLYNNSYNCSYHNIQLYDYTLQQLTTITVINYNVVDIIVVFYNYCN